MWTLYTANAEHWIPIATLVSFKRMREFSDLGIEWVANALCLSEDLEVDETKTSVRRRTEVQEPKGQFERSIYAVRHSVIALRCDKIFTTLFYRKGSVKRNPIRSKNWSSSFKNMARLTP